VLSLFRRLLLTLFLQTRIGINVIAYRSHAWRAFSSDLICFFFKPISIVNH